MISHRSILIQKSKHETILIVDDDPISSQILSELLKKKDYDVYAAQDGNSALEIIHNNPKITIVLLDIMIPGISGYEVCRKIRESYSLYEKPIILITSKKENKDFLLGFSAGANDFLVKPYNQIELLARVNSLVKLHKTANINVILKSTNKTKTRLLEMASHALKNPLTIIKGNLSLLKRKDNEEYIKQIENAVNRMTSLTNQFLENSKMEGGKLILNRELSNLSRLLKIAINGLDKRAKSKYQELILKIEKDLWIEADEIYFIEILNNLIINCINYSPKRKIIWISCYRSGIENVKISIKDEGPGMSEDDLKKIFIPYAKLSARTTSKESSTGLGLVIAKQLIELHGGLIEVVSSKFNGCEFLITMPIYDLEYDKINKKDY